ncbi:hypothetical protein DEJ45_04140 [Streptomyces venezuelae]|uniref:hypothetical protein n=1 Tax=Streptomyces venezuelae TaxID=54571 RepID=UPI00123D6BA8|nr:hypothetical protein [Streptomyces venezuelae]QES11680.1 hypothetical protein DEJ45_04140 [Streptomyces venezuelae]
MVCLAAGNAFGLALVPQLYSPELSSGRHRNLVLTRRANTKDLESDTVGVAGAEFDSATDPIAAILMMT